MAKEYLGLRRMSVQRVSLQKTRNVKEKRSKCKNSYVTGRLRGGLTPKVRHEEVILILVCQNGAFEVRSRDLPVPSPAQDLGTHGEGGDFHDVRRLGADGAHVHTQRK